jgi:hypothetical protein
MERPCCAAFLGAFDNVVPPIHRSASLRQVKAKLLANGYASISEWKNDINFLWQTAQRLHGTDSILGIIANEFRKYFEQLINGTAETTSSEAWHVHALETWQKLRDVMAAPLPIPSLQDPICVDIPAIPPMSFDAADQLVSMSSHLTSTKDAQALLRIILHFQPNTPLLSKHMSINIDSMPPIVVWSLERYIKERLRELGKMIPHE